MSKWSRDKMLDYGLGSNSHPTMKFIGWPWASPWLSASSASQDGLMKFNEGGENHVLSAELLEGRV